MGRIVLRIGDVLFVLLRVSNLLVECYVPALGRDVTVAYLITFSQTEEPDVGMPLVLFLEVLSYDFGYG